MSRNALEPEPNDTPETRHTMKSYKRPNNYEGQYLADNLGSALTLALAEIAERRPWDPIEYLAHFLYKFRANMEYEQKVKWCPEIISISKLQPQLNKHCSTYSANKHFLYPCLTCTFCLIVRILLIVENVRWSTCTPNNLNLIPQ